MGTISDKLMRIINTKEDIRQALISKGYDVPTSIPFKEYAKMISDLPCRVDSFPDIEGIVARYSALGLTNEQMAANPVWVDKTGNGHDLQMKNFAWKEGSGISDIYPGALVFDGVDDYGTCDNFPVLTKEKGYTVVSLRKYITPDPKSYLISNGDTARLAAFLVEGNFPTIQYWNFGAVGNLNYIDNLPYVYQTSKEYNGRSINKGDLNEGVTSLLVCKYGSWHSNAAIWEIVILDHDATEEELTKIKDYFVKTYPWLFPDQAWTVTGKTNEDEDRATIANITGNGNDLVLSNFGFAEGSGYGLYAENYNGGRWVKSTNRADLTWTSYSVNITSVKVASTQLYYQSYPEQPSFTVPSYKIKVYGLKDGQTLSYKQVTSEGQQIYKISEDGIYTLPSFPFKANGDWYGFTLNKIQESCDITIEQIPEYEGYLVTDGVDDRVQDSSFKLNKDWTLVGEWVFLNQKATNAGITKPFSFVVYNRTTGLSLFINTGTSGITIENVKSIKAICSDGRIYLDDWSEMLISKDQDITSSTSVLSIGFNGTAYTQMAFKNLGIYNNQILSKDDCIKAYNYLQTLKAK